jgi:hypothetical protein
METQYELFDSRAYSRSINFPLLNILGIELNKVDDVPNFLLQITPKPGAVIYEYGAQYKSRFTNDYPEEEDNLTTWGAPRRKLRSLEGYLQAAATLDDNIRTPILHVLPWITDMDMSVAIRIEDIAEVRVYPDDPAEILAIYQNAVEDSGWIADYYLKAHGLPTDNSAAATDLAPYVQGTYWWPEPKLIYSADHPIS